MPIRQLKWICMIIIMTLKQLMLKSETVRFVVENKGVLVHEFNIATMMMHKKHGPEMLDMMKNFLMPNKMKKKKMKQMAKIIKNGPFTFKFCFS